MVGAALCVYLILVFTACQLNRAEKAAPGQPTMNELMHRRADARRQQQEKEKAMIERARALGPDDEQILLEKLKENTDELETNCNMIRQ